jgi:hypothetical protein
VNASIVDLRYKTLMTANAKHFRAIRDLELVVFRP